MRELTVYLNRDGLNTVETDQQTVRATESLSLVLENHGKPTHVHFHPDDELAVLGTIDEQHVFVPKGEWRRVDMQFMPAAEGTGRLEITAGYGQERTALKVEVDRPEDDKAAPDEPDADATAPATDPAAAVEDLVGEPLDVDRLRNPVVLGSVGAVLLLFVLLVVVNPVAALSSAVIGILVAVAIGGYLSDWDPFAGEES